ncbi:hypothetical protein GQ457_02G030280 [Hibiscus cannabinus]
MDDIKVFQTSFSNSFVSNSQMLPPSSLPNPSHRTKPNFLLSLNQNQHQNHPRGQATQRRSISHPTTIMTSSIGTHTNGTPWSNLTDTKSGRHPRELHCSKTQSTSPCGSRSITSCHCQAQQKNIGGPNNAKRPLLQPR